MKNVVAFSGGRGSETFLKSWNFKKPFHLDLLINPYDDGLSTGRIRDYVPGFLGPSDFRKNLVHFLHSNNNSIDTFFARILETRINSLHEAEQALSKSPLSLIDSTVEFRTKSSLASLCAFADYESTRIEKFDYTDCAIGNLVLAGLYLKHNWNFQKALSEFLNVFDAGIGLETVSNQNDVSLVAMTSNNEFLGREHLIVNGLYTGAITHLGFIPTSTLLTSNLFDSGIRSQQELNRIIEYFIQPSSNESARQKLMKADLLCYLPGTQNSSLFPSYKILSDDILKSKAQAKVLVMNLTRDHDMANWRRSDILLNALVHLGDQSNERRSITHVLLNSPSNDASLLDGPIGEICNKFEIELITKQISNTSSPSIHNGEAIIETLVDLL
jgi:2-phospho-L-lactate transferase/gluconeogenesis factor (CofD/UPF0052 family)